MNYSISTSFFVKADAIFTPIIFEKVTNKNDIITHQGPRPFRSFRFPRVISGGILKFCVALVGIRVNYHKNI